MVFIILLIISGLATYQQAFEYEKLGEYEKAVIFYKKSHPVLLDYGIQNQAIDVIKRIYAG